jgi:hypothetical protein
MKIKSAFSKLITNKYVLNIVLIISFINIIGYLMYQRLDVVIFFILLSFLISRFTNNMIIVLGVSLILVNLFAMKKNVEGLENNTSEENKDNKDKKNIIEDHIKNPVNNSSLPTIPQSNESFEVGRGKKSGQYNIDYASTVEDAYDELNKIIGGDGMKRLTNDTQGLIKQQMELTKAMEGMKPLMENMGPLLKQAESLLGSMDQKSLGSISEMAKKFTAGSNINTNNIV